MQGVTHKVKWPGSNHALYVTINDGPDGNPYEIFLNTKNSEHQAWTLALTRMISAVFRRGGDVSFVAEELKAVHDPRGGAWMAGKYVTSIPALIGGVIEKHMQRPRQVHVGGALDTSGKQTHSLVATVLKNEVSDETQKPLFAISPSKMDVGKPCPKCASYHTKNESGCFQCLDCGESKCG